MNIRRNKPSNDALLFARMHATALCDPQARSCFARSALTLESKNCFCRFIPCTNSIPSTGPLHRNRLFRCRCLQLRALRLTRATFPQEFHLPVGGSYASQPQPLFLSAARFAPVRLASACALQVQLVNVQSRLVLGYPWTDLHDVPKHVRSPAPSNLYPQLLPATRPVRCLNSIPSSVMAFQKTVCSSSSTTAPFSSWYYLFPWQY